MLQHQDLAPHHRLGRFRLDSAFVGTLHHQAVGAAMNRIREDSEPEQANGALFRCF